MQTQDLFEVEKASDTCHIATGLPWTTVLGSIGRFASRCFWSVGTQG